MVLFSALTQEPQTIQQLLKKIVIKFITYPQISSKSLKSSQITRLFINHLSCCGAGTAADTEYTTRMISSQLELHRLNTGRPVRVTAANRLLRQYLFRYQPPPTQSLTLL